MDDNTQDTATLLKEQAEAPKQSYADDYQSLGQLFTQAREYHKLSIEDVAKQLCLTEDKIRAIESDHLQNFDAPIYARGYVDTYAKLVGVPKKIWEPMLSKLGFQIAPKVNIDRSKTVPIDKSIASMNGSLSKSRRYQKKQKPLWFAAGILVLLLVIVGWWSMSSHPVNTASNNTNQQIPIQLQKGS